MKKKVLALVMTLAMLASLVTVPAAAAGAKGFPDAQGHWAEKSILRWSRSGLVKGDENGNVNPNKPLRRCEMATLISDMLGLSTSAPISTFKDINGNEWYARAILRCAAAGIMKGSNSMSYPEDPITREEAITMFCRALDVPASDDPDLRGFMDGDEVSGWAAPYMATLADLGILSGMGNGNIAPHDDINRAGAFALMDKAISVYANAPGVYTSQNANGFVVINANDLQGGEVTVTGKANGVLVTVGETNTVRLRDLKAENVVVDGKGDVEIAGESDVDTLAVNTPVAVNVEEEASVDTLDVKAEKVTVTNAGKVKTLNCAKVGNVTNSGKVTKLVADAASVIRNTGTVETLVANAPITVDNTKGAVQNAEINMGGVVMDGPPQKMTIASGVARPANSSGRPITATGAVYAGGSSSSSSRPSGGGNSGSTTVSVTEVTLDQTEVEMTVGGENVTLKATVKPTTASNQAVTWTSSNEEVAKVEGGVVTAVAEGEATITVTTTDGKKTATCKVTVKDESEIPDPPPADEPSIKLDKNELTLTLQENEVVSETLTATVQNAEGATVEWTVTGNDEGVVSTTQNEKELTVTAEKVGKVIITATITVEDQEYTDACTVTVKEASSEDVPVASVTIDATQKPETVEVGTEFILSATVLPADATDPAVTWTSSAPETASVDQDGKVTALATGEVTITATAGEQSDTCTFTIVEKSETPDPPSEPSYAIALDKNELTLVLTETYQLNASVTVTPEGESAPAVVWTSSAPTVAAVENGLVTAKMAGDTVITATVSGTGVEAKCVVKVAPQMTLTVTVQKDGETVGADKEVDTGITVDLKTWLELEENQTVEVISVTTDTGTTATSGVLKKLEGNSVLVCDFGKATVTVKVTTPGEGEGAEATTETLTYTITLTKKNTTEEPGGETGGDQGGGETTDPEITDPEITE